MGCVMPSKNPLDRVEAQRAVAEQHDDRLAPSIY